VIGTGATSVVWRARDRRRGRDVAVKVLAVPGADRTRSLARFEHETRALARLADEPHVLGLLAAGTDGAVAWLVTPLAEATLPDRAPLPADGLVDLACGTAAGLAAAHGREVVHGDVTPPNVLWVEAVPVLSDFGLAILRSDHAVPSDTERPVDTEPHRDTDRPDGADDGAARGLTPGYAAPERWDGVAPSAASDVYGWGATMWSASTGERPPSHDPPDPGRLPRGVADVVRACCSPEAAERPTMTEVRVAMAGEARRRGRYCPDP
jgi:serine/threonine protein kinase